MGLSRAKHSRLPCGCAVSCSTTPRRPGHALYCRPPTSRPGCASSAPSGSRSVYRSCNRTQTVSASTLHAKKNHSFFELTDFLTSQSSPAVYSSSSFWPKQTSSTGARCSNFCMSFPSPIVPFSSLRSYRYTFLSHDDTTKRVDSGSGENWTADITSEGGFAMAKWSRKPCSVHGSIGKRWATLTRSHL